MLAAAAVSEELGSIFTYVLTLQGYFSFCKPIMPFAFPIK